MQAISKANGNLSAHLDNTVLGLLQFPSLEGMVLPPLLFWVLHSLFLARKRGEKGDFSATNARALWLNQHASRIKPRII